MEYLKNLVLQLYTTGEAEALLPVFAAVLSLGPEEVKKCKVVRMMDKEPSNGSHNVLSSEMMFCCGNKSSQCKQDRCATQVDMFMSDIYNLSVSGILSAVYLCVALCC